MNQIRSIFRFIIVGGSCTAIDFALYMWLSSFIHISFAKGISISIASICSFYANKWWTFKDDKPINVNQVIKYIATMFINLSSNVGTNWIVFNLSHDKILSFFIATGFATVVNFVLQKKLVFKK